MVRAERASVIRQARAGVMSWVREVTSFKNTVEVMPVMTVESFDTCGLQRAA